MLSFFLIVPLFIYSLRLSYVGLYDVFNFRKLKSVWVWIETNRFRPVIFILFFLVFLFFPRLERYSDQTRYEHCFSFFPRNLVEPAWSQKLVVSINCIFEQPDCDAFPK